jgi:hypothetical protein
MLLKKFFWFSFNADRAPQLKRSVLILIETVVSG